MRITCKDQTGREFTYEDEQMLSGWDQGFAQNDTILNYGDGPVIKILIEPPPRFDGVTPDVVAYLFNDKYGAYTSENAGPAFEALKMHFYNNLSPSLRRKFDEQLAGQSGELSMIIVPRFVVMNTDFNEEALHRPDSAREAKPHMCVVSSVGSASASSGAATSGYMTRSKKPPAGGKRRKTKRREYKYRQQSKKIRSKRKGKGKGKGKGKK